MKRKLNQPYQLIIVHLSDELAKLNSLRESGVLTQEEFEKAKNKLLNS
jgi:hypothetical protein